MSQVPCPTCGSLKSRLAKKSERPDVWFNIKSFRKCEECGWVFEPPSGRALGGIVVLVGVCMIAAPLPGLIESLSPFRPSSFVFYIIGTACCLYGSLQVLNRGIWALRTGQPERG